MLPWQLAEIKTVNKISCVFYFIQLMFILFKVIKHFFMVLVLAKEIRCRQFTISQIITKKQQVTLNQT